MKRFNQEQKKLCRIMQNNADKISEFITQNGDQIMSEIEKLLEEFGVETI